MGLLEDAIREHLELKRRHGANADEVARAERDALGPPGRPTPLEDAAAAHAAETTRSATEAPEPFDLDEDEIDERAAFADDELEEPAAVAETELDEPVAVADDELFEADEPARLYEPEPLEDESELFAEEEPPLETLPGEQPAPEYELETETETETEAEAEAEVGFAEPEAGVPPVPPEAAPDAPTRIAAAPALEAEPSPEEMPTEPPGGAVAASAFDFPPAEPAEPAEPLEGEEPPREAEGEEKGEDVLEETPDFLQETPEHDRLWFEQKPPRDFDFGS